MIARFGCLTFDSGRRQVLREDGQALHLTRKAFDLLALLIEAAPRVVQKSEIHDRLWPGVFVTDSTLVALVKELRRELQDRDPASPIIRTSFGVGYAFCGACEEPKEKPESVEHWLVGEDRRIPLNEGENVIGRDPASAVWLDFSAVSRRHASVVVRGRQAELEDLQSKNGTLLGEAVVASRCVLHDGDSIRIGPVCMTYRFTKGGGSTETLSETRESPEA